MNFVNHANRGKSFEEVIEQANYQYKIRKIANIQKIETPIRILNYKKGFITGTFKKKSTVDFKGVYRGRAIAFDAKSTRNKTSFPLHEIKTHQYHDLELEHECGGISFVLVEFIRHEEVYFLPFDQLRKMMNRMWSGGRKSIAYQEFQSMPRIVRGNGLALDYIQTIKGEYFEKDTNAN